MTIHEAAADYLAAKRGALQYVEVSELGDQRIYYFGYLNGEELVELAPHVFSGGEPGGISMYLEAFAICARNESGAKIFNEVNRHEVYTRWDPWLVQRIVEQMGVLDAGQEIEAETKKG